MAMPPWVPGQETKPAPMPLLVVQSFVNTWDGDDRSDLLLNPAATRDWLTAAWQRLKACGNPDCQWAFYDRSHGGQAPGATWPPAATGSRTAGSGNASTDQTWARAASARRRT